MKILVSILFVAFLLSGCAKPHPFSAPSIELERRLDRYLDSHDPTPLYEWVAMYHGEAPGHQMRITFVDWGNSHIKDMNEVLKSWPIETRADVFDLLEWAAKDSGQKIKFKIPEMPNKPVEGTR